MRPVSHLPHNPYYFYAITRWTPLMLSQFSEQKPQALSPRYTWLYCIQVLVFFAVLIAAAAIIFVTNSNLAAQPVKAQLWVLAPVIILCTLFAAMSARAKKYMLSEHHLSFYAGVLFKSVVVQPFTRLQHIEITRGPLERVLGLATLRLFSAGGSQHTMAIPGLPVAAAERLRSSILDSKGLADEQ